MSDKRDEQGVAFNLEGATDLLNDAYEIVAGSSAILNMLYDRLQESLMEESLEMAGVVHVIRRCLNESMRKIGDADEALCSLKDAPMPMANQDRR